MSSCCVVRRITNVEFSSVATGLGDVLGNKGSAACSFKYDDTSFCFVNVHLAGTFYVLLVDARIVIVFWWCHHLPVRGRLSKFGTPPRRYPSVYFSCHQRECFLSELMHALKCKARGREVNSTVRSKQPRSNASEFLSMHGDHKCVNTFMTKWTRSISQHVFLMLLEMVDVAHITQQLFFSILFFFFSW